MLPLVATPSSPLTLANPPTEDVRRTNLVREPVPPPEQPSNSARERPLNAERDRSKGTDVQQESSVRAGSVARGDDAPDAVAADGRQSGGQSAGSGNEDQAAADESGRQARKSGNSEQLAEQDQQKLRELKARDREVRAHEQAHSAAGGRYAGSASYSFQRGPDGQSYAVGGEVGIDISPVAGDPMATISKMQTVYRAALAPAEPSTQDRRVAAEAAAQIVAARAELVSEAQPKAGQTADGGEVDGAEDGATSVSSQVYQPPGVSDRTSPVPGAVSRSLSVPDEAAASAQGRALTIEIYYLSRVVPPDKPRLSATA